MKSLMRKIRRRIDRLRYRRNYYLSKFRPAVVPPCPLHHLPDGFQISLVGKTGIRVIDNFCTQEEADYLINKARERLAKSRVVVDGKAVFDSGRTSSHAVVFHRYEQDPAVMPIVARGAMLAGVPVDQAEQIYVTRYNPGELYHGHYDVSEDFMTTHRLCTMLIYLNDLDENQGGATYFRDLNVAIRPRRGRAVCWTNTNPDGSIHKETAHASLPSEGEHTEKWVIQIWYRPYRMHKLQETLEYRQTIPGIPLADSDAVPDGAWRISSAS
jgi:prolyl 4-hydroxylase